MTRFTRYSIAILTAQCLASVMFCFALTAAEPLIMRRGTRWRFLPRPVVQPRERDASNWHQISFDDSEWEEGQGILGYGDADVQTRLTYGDDPQRKPTAAFFRTRFQISRRSPRRLIGGRVCCDDGAVVYVNGNEVFRFNLPDGPVDHLTFAARPIGPDIDSERVWRPFEVPAAHLKTGENLVAVSVHQVTSTSGDLAMGLELFALTEGPERAAFQQEIQSAGNDTSQVSRSRIHVRPVERLKFATGDP